MELEEQTKNTSDTHSLKIGNTKISLLKENSFMIETSALILDSINENIKHSHRYSKGSTQYKHVKISARIDEMVSSKKTKKALYEKIKMKFNADSVMPLTTFINKQSNKNGLDYNIMLHFIGNIGNQLTFLRHQGYSIPFFSLEDFIVIDNTIFSFINDEKIFKIDSETKHITIDYPMRYNKTNSFIPHNMKIGMNDQLDQIPMDIYFSTIYYSLAQLCVYIFLRKQIKNEEEYEKVSGPFFYTPLYWCLKRCLDNDETKRILLYM